ncbi:unnamed protein product [Phytophthora lilii]|uniref:Unnamed protein product n=1 Tax=Phytophthora lilii TaxID=2077276 RepID=A0A9W6XGJ7_9STRA|nr:unnamed protein product [Phytophthora lilii]
MSAATVASAPETPNVISPTAAVKPTAMNFRMTPDNSVIIGVMDILPTEVAGISLQSTITKDELLPKVHTHVPITKDQEVTQRAETSAEITAIQHEVVVKDVRGNTGLVPPADSLTPPTTVVSGVNCANKCMTPADARFSKKLQTCSQQS